ncbi:hypothetical protein DL546_008154 [Coniochaeta pulveracea]|uniref:CTLH domain-containing protein n=1 Tax=Coniochaeta pulveracea TaxID=177199 RepID=A0A420YG49_9PEZI|nr:hypothetical protein DL546_008154 [Coniochaeta pulveracea]
MSSLSAAQTSSGTPDINDVAFWERVAAHFREKLNRMSSAPGSKRSMFKAQSLGVKSPKSDINTLILDYLTMQGYPQAAEKFSKEANLLPRQEDSTIATRREIQTYIHSGQIELAIQLLNDLDPEILDSDPKLHFSLLRLQLVELIRQCNNGDIIPALDFATQQLGPRASTNEQFLDDLEKTMALLIFPHESLTPELAALLRPALRKNVADEVNKTIVFRQTSRLEAAIQNLARLRSWAETSARTHQKPTPDRIELGLSDDSNDAGNDVHDNGQEAMITN